MGDNFFFPKQWQQEEQGKQGKVGYAVSFLLDRMSQGNRGIHMVDRERQVEPRGNRRRQVKTARREDWGR